MDKILGFFRGKRTFPQRLKMAALPCMALSFTLLFFGPLDLAYLSREYVTWTAFDIFLPILGIWAAVFVCLWLFTSVIGGKAHAFLVSLWTGIAAAMYIQGAFLNPDLGTLDGHTIDWTAYRGQMAVGILIWLVILLIPHTIHAVNKRGWRVFVSVLCGALVIMQGVSLTVKLLDQASEDKASGSRYYLSDEDILKVGSEANITVFLLDTTNNDDVDDALAAYPDNFQLLHDFVRYDNANSKYLYTVPAIASMLTGQEWDCENVHINDYLNDIWSSEPAASFYTQLADMGWTRNFYIPLPEVVNDPAALDGIISNLTRKEETGQINRRPLLNLYKLSCYRYFPLALKSRFLIYTADISDVVSYPNAFESHWDFVVKSNSDTFSAGDDTKVFTFYYLHGTHKPFSLDERGRIVHSELELRYNQGYTDSCQQTAGFFYLINEYVRQLKELGLYEKTGIIILSDHGHNETADDGHQPILFVHMPGEYHESIQTDHTPVTTQDSFFATVMDMAGEDGSAFGTRIEDTVPGERRTRIYDFDSNYPKLGNSNFNVFREYRYDGDGDDLIQKFVDEDYTTIPLCSSYY